MYLATSVYKCSRSWICQYIDNDSTKKNISICVDNKATSTTGCQKVHLLQMLHIHKRMCDIFYCTHMYLCGLMPYMFYACAHVWTVQVVGDLYHKLLILLIQSKAL